METEGHINNRQSDVQTDKHTYNLKKKKGFARERGKRKKICCVRTQVCVCVCVCV